MLKSWNEILFSLLSPFSSFKEYIILAQPVSSFLQSKFSPFNQSFRLQHLSTRCDYEAGIQSERLIQIQDFPPPVQLGKERFRSKHTSLKEKTYRYSSDVSTQVDPIQSRQSQSPKQNGATKFLLPFFFIFFLITCIFPSFIPLLPSPSK